ncbi:MAG: O-antigen ligase family protein [bacterium]|nr:O-antigen ligase family protein [bacterium]
MVKKLNLQRASTGVDSSKLAQKLSWLIAGIFILLPFHALLTTWAGSNLGHLDAWRIWKDVLLVLMVPPALWLIWQSPGLKKWLMSSWITRLFGIYILLHIILGAWALHQHAVNPTALIYGLIINLRFIAFLLVCLIVASQTDFLRRHWQKILLLPAAVVVAFGLVQKLFLPYDFLRHFGYGKDTIPAYQTVDSNLDYRRIQSTLRGANPLGAYLVLIIPTLWLGLKNSRRLRASVAIASLWILYFSYSRSAEIGVAIALGILAWWSIGKKISWQRLVIVFVSLAVLASAGLYVFRNSQPVQDTLFHTSDSSASPSSSNTARVQAMKDGASDVIHQPLGGGPGTAGPASARNDHPARIAENYFLQIGQEVGVLGIAIFVAITVLVAKELWARRNDQLAKILLASLVGIIFVNLVSHAWTDDTLAYLWWGLAGVALSPLLKHKQKGV